jgi:AcrR family transcriptional regulator
LTDIPQSPDVGVPTRERIIAATIAILEEGGEPSLRLSAVAERAGLSTGAIYAAFSSREALVATANVERIRRWTMDIVSTNTDRPPVDAAPATPQGQEAIVRASLSPAGRAHRLAWAESAAQAMHDPKLAQVIQATEREFLDYTAGHIEKMQAANVIRPELDPRAVAAIRMAVAIGVAVTARAYDDDPEFTDRLVEAWPVLATAFLVPEAKQTSY